MISNKLTKHNYILHEKKHLTKPIPEWHGTYNENSWRIFNGNSKEVLGLLPKDSISCVITSPPYFWLRDYKVNGQIGLEACVDGYVVALTDIMEEVRRVLHPEGVCFLNLGDTYYSGKGESQGVDQKSSKRRFGLRAVDKSGGLGIGLQRKSIIGVPWRVAMKMCQKNWILRAPIIWSRQNCLPEAVKDRPRRGYEFVFMFVKSRRYYFNRNALPTNGESEDVWKISAKPNGNHKLDTAPFPDGLVEQCLKIGCPPRGIVLDPFCGCGTTVRVALKNNRNVVGIDLNNDFCKYILKSLDTME